MSDATGLFAGGTSDLLTVGASKDRQVCNLTDPGTDFFFSLNSDLAQCRPYPFTHYAGAILPITIMVHVPGGESFILHPPPADSFTWIANLTAGTPVAFSVFDSQNRIGGTSDMNIVQITNDTSCLSSSTPSTSMPSPSATRTTLPASLIKGLAVGITIGILGILGFLSLVGFFCYKRSRLRGPHLRPSPSGVDLTYDPGDAPLSSNARSRLSSSVPTPYTLPAESSLDSVQLRQNAQNDSSSMICAHNSEQSLWNQPQPFIARAPRSSTYSRHSKWSVHNQDTPRVPDLQTSSTHPSDVIVHTDISETPDGHIELPPQYSENRAPLPGFPTSPMMRPDS
ncbi:hypothetical protein AX17_000460 [Amanita inopinata Kibby_2008]|nr:hypothetical protein AX17_000460 [Amanita inopinata Kibby_2008]